MTTRRAMALGVLVGLALPAWAPPAAAQCAMCQTALTSSAEGRSIGAQFNRAILIMFFAPYVVFGCFVLAAFRRTIGSRLQQAGGGFRSRLGRHGIGPRRFSRPVPH